MDGDFKPLAKEPAYLRVCRAIEEKIVSGELADGAGLPTEADLCEQFAVTRSTVREGLRLLEQTGLVVRGPGKRLFISHPNTGEVAAATSRGLSLSGVRFREVWEALATVYPPAGRLAASRISDESLDALRAINAELAERNADDSEGIVAGAVGFFHEIAIGLENRVLLALLDSLNLTIEASLRRVVEKAPSSHPRIVEAQRHIIKALASGDADTAYEWMRRHTDDIARGCEVAGLDLDARVL